MKTKFFAPVYPKTLNWIRIELGLSLEQAAGKTKFSIKQLQNWENGTEKLTLAQTKKLAEKYKVSVPFLYLEKTPKKHHFKSVIDFRSASYQENFSDRLCLAIKTIHERQIWMREFLQAEEQKPLEWLGKFANTENVIKVAQKCQLWLGVRQDEIAALRDNKEALDYWKDKIELKGVVVASNHTHAAYKIDRDEYSGLVLYDKYAPFILLNPKDSPARRIFTLLHELAHLLVNNPESSLSLIDFRTDESEYDQTEVFCNNIAANILIDKVIIDNIWDKTLSVKDNIAKLTKQFKVSYSATAVAIKKIGIINQQKLDELLDFYKEEHKKKLANEQSKIDNGDNFFPPPKPAKQTLDRCGRLLTTQVLTAYEQGSISASEIHGVLGMKLKYLGDLSKRLHFPLHRWVE